MGYEADWEEELPSQLPIPLIPLIPLIRLIPLILPINPKKAVSPRRGSTRAADVRAGLYDRLLAGRSNHLDGLDVQNFLRRTWRR
jgi:hypothetical protein